MTNAAVLTRTRLFAGLAPGELEELARYLRRRHYRRGEVIFLRGDPGTSLYVLEAGRVKIALSSPEGKEMTLSVLEAGDSFGELALLDGQSRSADAVALEAAEVLLLPREAFLNFLETRPAVAAELLAALSQLLRHNADIVRDAAFLDVPARLARVLLRLAGLDTDGAEDRPARVAGLTQTELASLVGATRESVNKWLGLFERQGLIRRERGHIAVLRPEGLRKRIY